MTSRSERGLPGRRHGRRGFTLVEVLLALSILAFGLVGVMVARGRAVETALVAQNLKVARLLAEHLLAEIESGLREDMIDGEQGDFAEAGYPTFDWRVAIGEESVGALDEARDDESLAGYYAEKELERRDREAAGEEPPAEPTTLVAVRVTFPSSTETRGSFTIEARVATEALEEEDTTEGAAADAGPSGGLSPGVSK